MRVSSLMVVYNYEQYVEEALESLLAQEHCEHEIIVVDDGSTDRTAEIIKRFSQLRYVHQAHRGIEVARNRAIQESNAEFFHFLDADDIAPPNRIATLLKPLREDAEIALSYGAVREFRDAAGQRQWLEIKAGRVIGAMMIRRSDFDRVGAFREDLQVGGAADWLLRANEEGLKEYALEEIVLLRRQHGQNTSLKSKHLMQREWAEVMMASVKRKREKDQ